LGVNKDNCIVENLQKWFISMEIYVDILQMPMSLLTYQRRLWIKIEDKIDCITPILKV